MALTALSETIARWIEDWRWRREERRMTRDYRQHEGRKPTAAEVRRWERQASRRYNRGAGKAPSGREIRQRRERFEQRREQDQA